MNGKLLLIALAGAGFATSASAGLVGVKEIKVYSAIPDWVQVVEVIATQTGTGIDVALASNGATATATSEWDASSGPSKAIDGIYPSGHWDVPGGEWHSGTIGVLEHLDVMLASPTELDSLTIYGRLDCCQGRDLYNVYLYDSGGNQLYAGLNADARTAGFVTLTLPNTSVVPEPTTLSLIGLGLMGIGLGIRRRPAR